MAEDKVESRAINFRQLLPWTEIFRGFQVALDPQKLLLAAGGIFVMWLGWWLLATAFYGSRHEPTESDYDLKAYGDVSEAEAKRLRQADLESDKAKWNLLHQAAGPNGVLRVWPGSEPRGPNPYLLVTGKTSERLDAETQALVLLEPLVKFLKPVTYLLQPDAGFWNYLYFLLVFLWSLATWAFFGGAITRMAAVQATRKEKIGVREALRFAVKHYVSFLFAPLFPLLFVLVVVLLLIVYGALHMIPVFGDIVVDGVGYPLVILAGVVMAVILVGMVGLPLMYATISTEGSDSFDALSRSYSYVYQCPWHYLWNNLVAVGYGVVLVFFIGFMGSFMVYLGKWGVSQTPFSGKNWANREPAFLYVYTPESFGWRTLLLEGTRIDNENLVENGQINLSAYNKFVGNDENYTGSDKMTWYMHVGAVMVAFWLTLLFLMVVGFGYSYFWSASTIIYLLMRRQVDDTDLDEVYLEEDETESPYFTSSAPPAPTTPPEPEPKAEAAPSPTVRKTMLAEAPAEEGAPAKEGDGPLHDK